MMKPALLLPIPARTGRAQKNKSPWAVWSAASFLAIAAAASALALLAARAVRSPEARDFLPPAEIWEGLDAAREFRLTEQSYSHGSHIEACSSEFGPAYQIADWEHDLGGRSMSARAEESAPSDLGRLTADQVRNLSDRLRIPTSFNSRFYFVNASSQSGQAAPATYHYFERHDGRVPGDFVASDRRGGLSLSSYSPWHRRQNITGQVLCVHRSLGRALASVDGQPALEAPAPAASWVALAIAREFRFTEQTYTAQSHSEACPKEFGSSYQMADWSHDLGSLTAEQLGDFGGAMGLPASPDPRFFVVGDQGWKFPAQLNYTGVFVFARAEAVDQQHIQARHGPFALSVSRAARAPVLCVKTATGGGGGPPVRRAPSFEARGGIGWTNAGGRDFRLTQHRYRVLEEFGDDMCSGEYGAAYEVADWTVDLCGLSVGEVRNLTETLGIPASRNARFYLVTADGKARHSWDYYYFERHDGAPPSDFRGVGRHGPLSLGHAEYVDGPALCVYRGSAGSR